MIKYCFVTTISGTLSAFVLDTAKYLHEQGNYDVSVVCSHDAAFEDGLPSYIHYFPVAMERGVSLGGIKACISMYNIFRREKFDIVQYSTPNASLYASLAAKMCNIPVRLYCQWGIVYVSFSGFKRKIFKLIEKTVCSLSTWIEPDSFGNLKFSHLEGLYSSDKSSVIWNGSANGVDLDKFDIQKKNEWRREIRAQYAIDSKTFVVGFVGRLTRDKGLNELLEAFKVIEKNYTDTKLLIVGSKDNTQGLDTQLLNWALENDNIIFSGHTLFVERHLATLDVFVLPSYREGFGSVIIEAEAIGVPVIVTDIPGPTDAMLPFETGLVVKKGSADDLIKAIVFLLKNQRLREKFGVNGRRFVVENFDRRVLMMKIEEDRKRLINKTKI